MAEEKKETALTVKETTETGLVPAAPDWIENSRDGLENIGREDILIPRLCLAQALSPQVTDGDPKKIEGLTPGCLFNSTTGQNYGREVFLQILRKDKLRAMEFYSVDDGGGVKDPNVPLDDPRLKWGNSGNKKDDKPKATLFRDYIAVILPQREMIALSFKSSGIRVAKDLNGKIVLRGEKPIYAGRYVITTKTELKPKPHWVFVVDNAGWVSQEDYILGKRMYEAVKNIDMQQAIDRDETTVDPADDEIPF